MDGIFRGEFEYAVDDRGRVVIPPQFREGLTSTVYIGRGAEGQIWVYPKPSFDRMLEEELADDEDQAGDFDMRQRFWLAANEVEVDRQGRLSLSGLLRKQAGIGTSAILAGNGDRVEIWSPERLDLVYARYVAAEKTRPTSSGARKRPGLRP